MAKSAHIGGKRLFPLLVVVPLLAWYVLFMYYPAGYSIWASLHLWVADNPILSTFVGLKNYIDLFTIDPRFLKSLANTFIYVVTKTALVIPIGLMIALLLERLRRGTKVYIFAVFLPALCSATAIGILFTYLFQPSFGLFNAVLRTLHLSSQPFLTDAKQAIFCVIATDAWQYMGFTTLISYTGLMNIPYHYVEAARVDGARAWRTFFSIKLPIMGHTLVFLVVYTVINAFQSFDFVFIMTQSGGGTGGASGGPGYSSSVLSLLVYNEGMLRPNVDKATAVATIIFLIVLALTIVQYRLLRPKWEY
jgi:multiple sugar transport system permease protein